MVEMPHGGEAMIQASEANKVSTSMRDVILRRELDTIDQYIAKACRSGAYHLHAQIALPELVVPALKEAGYTVRHHEDQDEYTISWMEVKP